MLTDERNPLLATAARRATAPGGDDDDDDVVGQYDDDFASNDDEHDFDPVRHGRRLQRQRQLPWSNNTNSIVRYCSILTCMALLAALVVLDDDDDDDRTSSFSTTWEEEEEKDIINNGNNFEKFRKIKLPGERPHSQHHQQQQQQQSHSEDHAAASSYGSFTPIKRCAWVQDRFDEKDADKTPQQLAEQYAAQGVDVNVFYRATANLFWQDFRDYSWDTILLDPILQAHAHHHQHHGAGFDMDDDITAAKDGNDN
jgi:hypothetical protein